MMLEGAQFNLQELRLIEDCVRFTFTCLDRECEGISKDCYILLKKVEKLVKNGGSTVSIDEEQNDKAGYKTK